MAIICTRCDGIGFINVHQISDDELYHLDSTESILEWIDRNQDSDVQICDCCGDGTGWYGEPGYHYNNDDPQGNNGPYAYNGGLCECH